MDHLTSRTSNKLGLFEFQLIQDSDSIYDIAAQWKKWSPSPIQTIHFRRISPPSGFSGSTEQTSHPSPDDTNRSPKTPKTKKALSRYHISGEKATPSRGPR